MWTAFACSQYERLNDRYASDVTDDEFGLIEPLLPSAECGGQQRTTDLREVLNPILYLVRATGLGPRCALPVADVTEGVPAEEHGLPLFPALFGMREYGIGSGWSC